jgi:hypothetical protein
MDDEVNFGGGGRGLGGGGGGGGGHSYGNDQTSPLVIKGQTAAGLADETF